MCIKRKGSVVCTYTVMIADTLMYSDIQVDTCMHKILS